MKSPAALAALTLVLAGALADVRAQDAPPAGVREGTLASGASFRFDLPARWNGSVLLYSHGYAPGPANPARNVARDERAALLDRGHALIGSSYARTGWALADAVPDQLATLDRFIAEVGPPRRVLAWGSSMGGLVTIALLERHPERFDGGLALCASAAGSLGMMNTALDGAFVFKTLQAPHADLPLRLNATGPAAAAARAAWQATLDAAQATPAGRARIALAATLAQIPTWVDGQQPPPAADDAQAQQRQLQRGFPLGVLLPRDDQEARAGGNFSWNHGIDYAEMLRRSGREAFVRGQYAAAVLDLQADLQTLAQAPRIEAQPGAVAYMKANYVPQGELRKPMLLLQTVADPLTLTEFTGDYVRLAARAGRAEMARGIYVRRSGHCNFTLAETLAAIDALDRRVEGGAWSTRAAELNAAAAMQAHDGAAFVDHEPAPLLRSCSARAGGCPGAPW